MSLLCADVPHWRGGGMLTMCAFSTRSSCVRSFRTLVQIGEGFRTGFEANTEQQIGMMLAQVFIDKGSRNGLGWLGAEKYRHVGRQVLAQKCVGELRIAQHLFEKCVVDEWALHDDAVQRPVFARRPDRA